MTEPVLHVAQSPVEELADPLPIGFWIGLKLWPPYLQADNFQGVGQRYPFTQGNTGRVSLALTSSYMYEDLSEMPSDARRCPKAAI